MPPLVAGCRTSGGSIRAAAFKISIPSRDVESGHLNGTPEGVTPWKRSRRPSEPLRLTTVDVTEDYRWLEDSDSERTKAWTTAQDARTRAYTAEVPDREPIRRRFREISPSSPRSTAHCGAAETSGSPSRPSRRCSSRSLSCWTTSTTSAPNVCSSTPQQPRRLRRHGNRLFSPAPDDSLVGVALTHGNRTQPSTCTRVSCKHIGRHHSASQQRHGRWVHGLGGVTPARLLVHPPSGPR